LEKIIYLSKMSTQNNSDVLLSPKHLHARLNTSE